MARHVNAPWVGKHEEQRQRSHFDADNEVGNTDVNISVGERVAGLENVLVVENGEDDLNSQCHDKDVRRDKPYTLDKSQADYDLESSELQHRVMVGEVLLEKEVHL